jgi:hypothetical protein
MAGYLICSFALITDYKMKKIYLLFLLSALITAPSDGQFLKDAKKFLKANSNVLTEKDATDGIREALIKGTGESVSIVSALDGYWKNPDIKIPFPPEAQNMETKLRAIGMGKTVDQFNESINRAAEKAAVKAKPIFISAIKGMTVKDALNIVKGEKNAATMYLKKTTSPDLKNAFKPEIKTSLDAVNATKYWGDLVSAYNVIPFVKKMNPDLPSYVTDRAVEGLFIMIAREELKIRTDPMARTSELLKKVFGK